MKYLTLFFLVFIGLSVWAQDLNFSIKGKITNQDTGGSEGGVTVTFKRNGTVVSSATSSSSGKYVLNASGPMGSYEIVYSKPGFVSKKIMFDVSGVNEEDLPAGNEIPFPPLDIDIFTNRPNLDFSFLDNEPVASFSWDNKKAILDYDRVASDKTRKKINDLLLKSEQEAAQNEANYNKAIQAADALSDQKKYEEAVAKYEEALGYKPKEAYPANRINELEGLIQAQKQAALIEEQSNAEYNNLIKAADNLRNSGDLAGAVSKYKEALTKKNEQYPKDQITLLEAKIEQQKKEAENEAAYKVAVEKGDMFLKQNSLRAAKDKYTEATNLKPSEEYPKQKLKEIEEKMKAAEELAQKKQKYEEAIAAGDAMFNSEDFAGAKAKYQEALTYESAATYPKERIKLCDEQLAKMDAEQKKQEEIKRLLAEGNKSLTAKELEKAKASFEGVLALEATNAEAISKLADVERLLKEAADSKAKDEEFNKLIADGDAAMTSQDFESAINKFQSALAIKKEAVVEQKLKSAQDQLTLLKDKEAKTKAYNDLIAAGDNAFNSGDYATAKAKFQEASKLDATQQYPKDKLKAIEDKLAELDKTKKYEETIKLADQLFSSSKFEDAKRKYQEALEIDSKQSYPVEQIKKIDAELENLAAAKDREDKYKVAIAKADLLYSNKKWQEAINAYDEAIGLASDASYAEGKKAEAAAKLKEANDLAAKQAEFDRLLNEGKDKVSKKDWANAKESIEAALGIMNDNLEAQNLLKQVNSELAKEKSAAEQEAEFERLKNEGQSLYDGKDYTGAKLKFNEALAIKEDQVIRKKLGEIDAILADQTKQKELEEKYNQLMNEGASLENKPDYQGAINKYKEAIQLKPDENAPKERIAFLQQKIAQESDQAKIDQEYKAFMQKGDQLMADKNYLDAIKEFNKALALKPSEKEPVLKAQEAERLEREKSSEGDKQYEKILTVAQTKIDERDYTKATELLERAKSLKPEDQRPIDMLANIEKLKQEDAKYNQLLSQASGFEASKNYTAALTKYEEALTLRPTESLPKEKIESIKALMANQNEAKAAEELYKNYMAKGDVFVGQKEYEQALSSFKNALSAKPGDVAAQNKINEVQQILDDLANSEKDAMARKNEFDAKLKEADELFYAESYLESIKKYEDALRIDPSSTYAKKQISEAVRLEKEKGNREAEREYRKIIEAGDKNFILASYDKAREYYNRALTLKSGDPYPKQKLEEIDAILNPKMTASAELEDLGEPFPENSIMDGQALLEKAESQRMLLNGLKTKKKLDDISNAESEMTLDKTADHRENSNQIYQVQQLISQEAGESDLNRQATVEALKKSELERHEDERQNTEFEHAENLLDQEVLYRVNQEVALQYGEDILVYSENADHMEAFNRAQAERVSAEMNKDKNANIDADQQLSSVKLKVDQDVLDDIAEREEVREKVFNAETIILEQTTIRQNVKYEALTDNQKELDKVAKQYETKYVEDSRAVSNNEEELKIVKKNQLETETEKQVDKDLHLKQTDAEIRTVQLKVEEDSKERDDARKSNVEIIKDGNKRLAEENYNAYNDEMEKYVSNQATIDTEVNKTNEINEKADEALDRKIAYVEGVDKKARIDYEADSRSDEEERLSSQRGIETIYAINETTTAEEVEKHEESTTRLNDLTRTLDAEKDAQAKGEKEKLYNNAGALSGIDNMPKPKEKVANELGQEYPEGVSQESFTQKDQNGLMTAIITRRIVVINGHADVYVRTQTLHSITYAKNGNPTLEHVWNKETQGPNLERHY